MGAGGAISVGWSWLALYEEERRPFLQVAATLGFSTVGADSDDGRRHQLTAGDLRVGVLTGKTFFTKLTVFAALRGFAGPVFWQVQGANALGGDTHHFALGAGAIVRLPARMNVFAEVMALGERSLSVGTGVSF